MSRRQSKRGLSLLETVIALFVLLSAFTIVLTLLMRSNRALVQIEGKALAVAFSETVLDDLRVWATDYDNWEAGFGSWANTTLPNYPGFEAKIVATAPTVLTPCTQLEVGKPGAEQREMRQTARDLEITIENQGVEVFKTNTRLTEPARAVKEVQVNLTSGISSLSANQKAEFQAVLMDVNGRAIEDVSFHWRVQPDEGGNGTVRALATDYSRAEFENIYVGVDGVARYITGQCRVEAVARYRGREYFGQSALLEILP